MKKTIKLTESDLSKIIKRIIMEDYYNPNQLYYRNYIVSKIKRGPKYLHKYIDLLPIFTSEETDEELTKIPEVIYQYIYGKNF